MRLQIRGLIFMTPPNLSFSDCALSPKYFVPFKFIYNKGSQAHQDNWHQHDDRRAAVATITAVHERSFEAERWRKWAHMQAKII